VLFSLLLFLLKQFCLSLLFFAISLLLSSFLLSECLLFFILFLEESLFLLSSQFLLFFGFNSIVAGGSVIIGGIVLVVVQEGTLSGEVDEDWLLDHDDFLLFHNRHLLGETAVLDVTRMDDVAVGLADVAGSFEVLLEGHILVLVDISTHGDVLLLSSDNVLLVASKDLSVVLDVLVEVAAS